MMLRALYSLFVSNLVIFIYKPKKNKKMTKYTIKPDQTHGEVLCKNGKESICPFQPAIPTQSQMGGLAIMRIPCSTSCAHADYHTYNTPQGKIEEYTMNCTGNQIVLELETQPDQDTAKIIKF